MNRGPKAHNVKGISKRKKKIDRERNVGENLHPHGGMFFAWW